MIKRWLTVAMFAVVCLGFVADADAVFITSNGDLRMIDPAAPGSPPLQDIRFVQGGGFIFTNQVTGVPFTPVGELRSVSVHSIGTAQDAETYTDAKLPDGSTLLVISGIRGLITTGGPGGVVSATFYQGRTFLTPAPMGFNAKLPSTWNFAGTFAEYDLKLPEDAWAGPVGVGEQVSFPASLMNQSDVNSGAVQQTQGRFLVKEDSTPEQNEGATPGDLPGTGGDNFLSNVDDVSPPPLYKIAEGFLADIDQTLQFMSTPDILLDTAIPFGLADVTVANAIAAASFWDAPGGVPAPPFTTLVDLDPIAAGIQAWATGFNNAVPVLTDWDPGFPNAPTPAPFTGDFRAEFASTDIIGMQAIPEPASVAVWGLLAGLGLVWSFRRRR